MTKQQSASSCGRFAASCLGLLASAAVSAAGAWISVPSSVGGPSATVTGGGLKSGEVLTVRVTDPTGQQHSQAGAVASDGTLSVGLTPGAVGKHSVDVLDASGRRVGGGDFLYAR